MVCLLRGKHSLSPAEKQLKGPAIDLLFGAEDSDQLRLSFLCDLGKPINPALSAYWSPGWEHVCVVCVAGQHLGVKVHEVWVWIVSLSLGRGCQSLQPIWGGEDCHEPAVGWVPGR